MTGALVNVAAPQLGLIGEAAGIEARLGDRLQRTATRSRDPRRPQSTASEAFFSAPRRWPRRGRAGSRERGRA